MIRLNFTQYIEKLKNTKTVIFPTEHVYEGERSFVFFFKCQDKWEYYTIITKEDILKQGSIEDFKVNYCYGCLPVEESPVFTLDDFTESTPTYVETTHKAINFEELVKGSKSYSEFLVNMFDKFEKEVLKSVNKIDKKTNKNFGEFLSDMFNTVNAAGFAKSVKKLLMDDVNKGKAVAEKELNVVIPFNDAFEQKLMVLYNEQIDGYTINGKKWFGIKGVTKEIQQKVTQAVQSGINENKSNAEIAVDVKKTFSNFTDWRSNMIARTETNRIRNESQLLGYKESGIKGHKVWRTAPFEVGRSSEICQRMKNQEQSLDDPFIDPETNKAYMSPPAHPNCRSRVTFKAF